MILSSLVVEERGTAGAGGREGTRMSLHIAIVLRYVDGLRADKAKDLVLLTVFSAAGDLV